MTYVATLFLSPQQRWWGGGLLEPVRWAVISAAVAGLSLIVSQRRLNPTTPVLSHGIVALLVLMVLWMGLQSSWAMDKVEHADLLTYYVKFCIALVLVYKAVDSPENLKLFLWTYVLCCFYFGWIAFTTYDGGRFEGFGGAGLGEANAGGLALVTGIFAGSALFLAAQWKERVALMLVLAFCMNGLVTTVSRSGFLALIVGGLAFNYFTPQRFRKLVRGLSVLAVVLFLVVAGPAYWARMHTLKQAGENIEGMDTGGGRLEIIEAQFKMSKAHPLGCGAMCTAVLSPGYMQADLLTSSGGASEVRVRASHNTFMSFLVEQGIPGAILYVSMVAWIAMRLLALARYHRTAEGFIPTFFPALAAIHVSIVVGDMFVSYTKFEARIWFIAILMALTSMMMREQAQARTAPVADNAAAARKVRRFGPRPLGAADRAGKQMPKSG
jgi:O-antigen ligase